MKINVGAINIHGNIPTSVCSYILLGTLVSQNGVIGTLGMVCRAWNTCNPNLPEEGCSPRASQAANSVCGRHSPWNTKSYTQIRPVAMLLTCFLSTTIFIILHTGINILQTGIGLQTCFLKALIQITQEYLRTLSGKLPFLSTYF